MKKRTETQQLYAVLKGTPGLKKKMPLRKLGLRVISLDYAHDHAELAMREGGILLTFISEIHRFYSEVA